MSELRLFAIFELVVAGMFWGFGFIATIWALEALDAYEIMFLRFIIATAVGAPFVFSRIKGAKAAEYLRISFVPAILLTAVLIFQTLGLAYTTATKSAFITTLYVVLVPVLESVVDRRRLPLRMWGWVLVALVGTAMIVNLDFGAINKGDALTLICTVFATLQIYWIGKVSPRVAHPFGFNIYQCMWSMILSAPLILGSGLWGKLQNISNWPPHAAFGILSLAIGSTVLAFYLQVRAQAKLSATVSSLLFLLESPFALFFAVLLLGESLTLTEGAGALLIFIAAFAASLTEKKK